jgi:hypothetical protein
MFSFVQLGWFWLLVGSLLLLLAGCLLLPKQTPIEVPTSSHPLLNFTVMPFATENLQLRYLESSFSYTYTPTISTSQRHLSPPTDEDYYSSIPNCVASPNGGYSCLGRVWNNSNQDSGSILLSINLLNEQNQIVSKETFSLEQRLIPSQGFAPYRAIIPPQNRTYQQIEAKIEYHIPPDDEIRSLRIIDSRGQASVTGRYRLTTTILNDVGKSVEDVHLFVSLVDDEEQMVGYRIYEVGDNLLEGDMRVIELEIIPQAMPDSIHHELYVEGRALPE